MTKQFESTTEIVKAIKLALSSFFLGLGLGFVFYYYKPDMAGLIIGAFIAAVGLAIGIYLAIRVSKKVGASEFMSEINSTSDIDESWKDKSSKK